MIGELPITLIFGGTKAPKSLTINADPGILVEGEVIKIERHIDKYVIKSKQMVIDADWQKIRGINRERQGMGLLSRQCNR